MSSDKSSVPGVWTCDDEDDVFEDLRNLSQLNIEVVTRTEEATGRKCYPKYPFRTHSVRGRISIASNRTQKRTSSGVHKNNKEDVLTEKEERNLYEIKERDETVVVDTSKNKKISKTTSPSTPSTSSSFPLYSSVCKNEKEDVVTVKAKIHLKRENEEQVVVDTSKDKKRASTSKKATPKTVIIPAGMRPY